MASIVDYMMLTISTHGLSNEKSWSFHFLSLTGPGTYYGYLLNMQAYKSIENRDQICVTHQTGKYRTLSDLRAENIWFELITMAKANVGGGHYDL